MVKLGKGGGWQPGYRIQPLCLSAIQGLDTGNRVFQKKKIWGKPDNH